MLTPEGFGDEELATWLRLIAEQATGHAFILTNAGGRILWWNPAAEAIFGCSRTDIVGKPLDEFFTPADQHLGLPEFEQRIAQSSATAQDDRWHVKADGSRFWATGTLFAIRDPSGQLLGYCKILRDRTALKVQLEHLNKELDSARDAVDSRTASIATLSHELRNLVAAVTQGARLLRKTQDAERRNQLLDLLERQALAVHRLTEDLFDASSVSLGKLAIRTDDVQLTALVRQVVTALQPLAEERNLQLELLMPAGEIEVSADATRLFQVFSNLIDNAIKYTPRGGRIWVTVTTEDTEAVVHVQDSGIGIESHMLTSIFELFTRAGGDGEAEESSRAKGLGIGLALVKDLVALHAGSVQAASAGTGRGSQFTVRLPSKGGADPHSRKV